jgi:hypothetical protein
MVTEPSPQRPRLPDDQPGDDDCLADVRRRRNEAADALVDALLQMWVLEQLSRRIVMSRSNEIGGENG